MHRIGARNKARLLMCAKYGTSFSTLLENSMDLVIGIAIGTAFAPFWMMLYNKIKPIVVGWFDKKTGA